MERTQANQQLRTCEETTAQKRQPDAMVGNRDSLVSRGLVAAPVGVAATPELPRTAAPTLTTGPIQAKKKAEGEAEAGPQSLKPSLKNPVEEEYRPLSQRTAFSKREQAWLGNEENEGAGDLLQRVDNMDARFQTLKTGEDKEALYDFMRKVTSFGTSGKKGKAAYGRDESSVLSTSIQALMADPEFASTGFLESQAKILQSGSEQFDGRLNAVDEIEEAVSKASGRDAGKAAGKAEKDKLLGDEEMHKYISAVMSGAATAQFNSSFEREISYGGMASGDAMGSMSKAWLLLNGSWTHGEGADTSDYDRGNKMFEQDFDDITAGVENPVLPESVLNFGTMFETRGKALQKEAPAQEDRHHRSRRRRML